MFFVLLVILLVFMGGFWLSGSALSILLGSLVVFKVINCMEHVLSVLLSLEYFMLTNLVFLGVSMSVLSGEFSYLFVFFTCSVCEACVGVGLLLMMTRLSGSDSLNLVF